LIKHVRDDMVSPRGFDLRSALANRNVISITRRAKRIVFQLDDQNRFYIHLGMTGRLTVQQSETPLEPHTHLIALLDPDRMQLRFRDPRRFGGIFWIGRESDDSSLGPEPLQMKPSVLRQRLRKTKRAIKNALLDQKLIAGLGNIYVDESLFAAKIHPLKRADRLSVDETRRLSHAIKHTLRRAIHHRGSTLRDYVDGNGEAGGFQRLFRVYDRAGESCPRCRSAISRIVLGGRSTHFCPNCQPRRKSR
jgi:formamidopyrimidine-DNA glycosylase